VDLGLEPAQFEAIDINCLDNLPTKKMKKFEIGKVADDEARLGPRQIGGMTEVHEQWCEVVEIYSGCIVIPQGQACGTPRLMSKDMNCKYLAGMWQNNLEHQLLWKVKQAMPAAKKHGSRGP
jgi:hypothetical protein